LPQICRVVLSAYLHAGHLRKRAEFIAQRPQILETILYAFTGSVQHAHRSSDALKIKIVLEKETRNIFVLACVLRELCVFELHHIDVALVENSVKPPLEI